MRDLDFVWKALADPHRRRMLQVLRDGPRSAGELARSVALASNAASFHLRCLLAAGLVAVERRGRSLSYRLDRERLATWLSEAGKLAGASSSAESASRPRLTPQAGRSQHASDAPQRHRVRPTPGRKGGEAVVLNREVTATGPIPNDTLPTELL